MPAAPNKKPPFENCRISSLDEHKEYLAAMENEKWVRQVAYLNLTETISGFECRDISLFDLLLFRNTENLLFAPSMIPRIEDLAQFFWILSPHYSATARGRGHAVLNSFYKWIIYRRCHQIFSPPKEPRKTGWNRFDNIRHGIWVKRCAEALLRYQGAIGRARQFIEETFQDKQGNASGGTEIEFYSDTAFICAEISREYGWTESEVLHLPLKRIFQYLKEIRHHRYREKAGLSNRSSEILHRRN